MALSCLLHVSLSRYEAHQHRLFSELNAESPFLTKQFVLIHMSFNEKEVNYCVKREAKSIFSAPSKT